MVSFHIPIFELYFMGLYSYQEYKPMSIHQGFTSTIGSWHLADLLGECLQARALSELTEDWFTELIGMSKSVAILFETNCKDVNPFNWEQSLRALLPWSARCRKPKRTRRCRKPKRTWRHSDTRHVAIHSRC